MTLCLPPYPAYKDSGVEWLGQIPAHWSTRRLGASVTGCINGVWGADPNGVSDVVCVRVADFDRNRFRVSLKHPTVRAVTYSERGRRMLKRGDLLLEKSGGGELQPVGVVVLYDEDTSAVCSNFVARMPVATGYNPSYLTYLHSHLYSLRLNVRSIKQTIGIQNLDAYSYLCESVAFPPRDEQDAIVRFLEHTDRRVNRLIKAKRRLIELLHEQKQAVIHCAVTVGLDPDAPRKPSGVDWLGDIPAHWSITKLSRLTTKIGDGLHGTPEYVDESPYYFINGNNLLRGYIGISTGTRCVSSFEFSKHQVALDETTLLLSINGTIGNLAYYRGEKVILGKSAAFINCAKPLNRCYLFCFLQSGAVRNFFRREVTGTTIFNLSLESIKNLPIAFPPLGEQAAIVAHIERENAQADAAIDRTRREIELIREYRTRLIADVVTGKIDVRGVPVLETAPEWDTTGAETETDDEADADDTATEKELAAADDE